MLGNSKVGKASNARDMSTFPQSFQGFPRFWKIEVVIVRSSITKHKPTCKKCTTKEFFEQDKSKFKQETSKRTLLLPIIISLLIITKVKTNPSSPQTSFFIFVALVPSLLYHFLLQSVRSRSSQVIPTANSSIPKENPKNNKRKRQKKRKQ